MSVLDKLNKTDIDKTSLMPVEPLEKVKFSPREYNRVILIYEHGIDDFYVDFPKKRLKENFDRIHAVLTSFGTPFQIGITTDDEMKQSGKFVEPIEMTFIQKYYGKRHKKPEGDIVAILFNIKDYNTHFQQAVRQICNLYAAIQPITCNSPMITIMTYSQYYPDKPDIYRLVNDDVSFPLHCYEVMCGYRNLNSEFRDQIADEWCGDRHVGINDETLNKLKESYSHLSKVHDYDGGITIYDNINITLEKPLQQITTNITVRQP